MNKTEAIQRVHALYTDLNRLVMEWDPYGLSRAGEISDEFSLEVWQLLLLLPEVRTAEDCVRAVRKIFSEAFGPDDFTLETCREFGVRVYRWWSEQE